MVFRIFESILAYGVIVMFVLLVLVLLLLVGGGLTTGSVTSHELRCQSVNWAYFWQLATAQV
jgi:hypothetical protein